MISGRILFLSALAVVALACAPRSEQNSAVSDTSAVVKTIPSAADTQAERIRIDSAMGYPFTLTWIPGQRDSQYFDVLSKYRAHSKRLSSQLLVLTLDTPVVNPGGATNRYLVADSTIVTGLSYGDFFKNDCTAASINDEGLITGLGSTDQGRHHPRLAWQFDTVSLRIRPLPADSVWCVQDEVD